MFSPALSLWHPALFGRPLPSLDLDLLSATAATFDSRLSFSRTTLAWQYDATGTLVTAPHNLLTHSDFFANAAWTKTAATVSANAAVAPDGMTTGDMLIEDGTTGEHRVSQTPSATLNAVHAVSVYVRSSGGTRGMRLLIANNAATGNALSARFDQAGGVFSVGAASAAGTAVLVGAAVQDIGGGWYRCSLAGTPDTGGSAGTMLARINLMSTTTASYTGDGTSGLYLWGAQLEQHPAARAYLSTSVKNLLGYSEAFDNAAWSKVRASVVANAAVSPDGTLTADRLVEDGTASNTHFARMDAAIVAGARYTWSAYAKAGERSQVMLGCDSATVSASDAVVFTLSGAGTASVVAGTPTATITAVGDGWYRCAVTFTCTASGTGIFRHYLAAAAAAVYTGDGTSGAFLWGAQVSGSGSLDAYSPNAAAAPSSAAYHGPRLDYDPSTAVVRRNLLTYSEQLDNAAWVKFGTVAITANATAAPDGTTTADQVTFTTASAGTYQAVGGAASATYTFSVWLRAASSTPCRVVINTNLSDPVISTVTVTTAWQRFSVTKTTSTGTTTVNSQIQDSGSGGTTVYAWGAQLETGSTATAYVPSTVVPGVAADVPATARGLLVEEARTNLLTYSEQFDNAAWTKIAATVSANATTAPDGTVSGDKFVESAATAVRAVYGTATIAAGATVTFSIHAKAGERTLIQLVCDNGSTDGFYANFDLSAGTASAATVRSAGTALSAAIAPASGGWYRCSITGSFPTVTAARCAVTPVLSITPTAAFPSYAGDGSSGLHLWGAQLEAGAFPTSYVPTSSATVTRAADVCSMPVGSWFNAAEGTLFVEARALAAVTGQIIANLTDGTSNNSVYLGTSPSGATTHRFGVVAGGVSQAAIGSSGWDATATNRLAGTWKANDFAACRNGGAVGTDASGTVPAVTTLNIGRELASGYWNGHIRAVRVYPRRLPDATLQAITVPREDWLLAEDANELSTESGDLIIGE